MKSVNLEELIPGKPRLTNTVSLFIPRSVASSRTNKTGSWRFARPVHRNQTAPCTSACPAGNHIPKIEMHMSRNEIREAFDTLMMENPMPSTCGRVCFHTCEGACNRTDQENPVAIRCLERYIGDTAIQHSFSLGIKPLPANQRRIAIIGAGPAGLSAAYFLSLGGFSCTVFESTPEPGGVLRWGIPAYRLPKNILKQEIDRILALGVDLRCNHPVDTDFFARAAGEWDAVFVGPGLADSLSLGVPGDDLAEDGLAFLMDVQTGKVTRRQGRVAVIGGGNTAIDVVRTLKRLGADPIIVYRRRQEDMPAFGHEVRAALAEGIELQELAAPESVRRTDDGLALGIQAMKSGPAGSDGRSSVVPDAGNTRTLELDGVISCIGARLSGPWAGQMKADPLVLSHLTMSFGRAPVLFGGDAVNRVQSVTDAIASGKQAAIALEAYFEHGREGIVRAMEVSGLGNGSALSMEIWRSGTPDRDRKVVSPRDINTDYFDTKSRQEPLSAAPESAAASFAEIEESFTPGQALDEAGRCYNCGFCNECDNCRIFCPEVSLIRESGKKVIDLDYCKGCGVCFAECPRSAISMEEEK
ncbi:MAG: FAD-dependent oxidoreductase [Pseudomonadota bacterium]